MGKSRSASLSRYPSASHFHSLLVHYLFPLWMTIFYIDLLPTLPQNQRLTTCPIHTHRNGSPEWLCYRWDQRLRRRRPIATHPSTVEARYTRKSDNKIRPFVSVRCDKRRAKTLSNEKSATEANLLRNAIFHYLTIRCCFCCRQSNCRAPRPAQTPMERQRHIVHAVGRWVVGQEAKIPFATIPLGMDYHRDCNGHFLKLPIM